MRIAKGKSEASQHYISHLKRWIDTNPDPLNSIVRDCKKNVLFGRSYPAMLRIPILEMVPGCGRIETVNSRLGNG
jgi:hypothetical protein